MSFSTLLPDFHRLQWKLTFTYTLVTTAAILIVQLILLLAAWFILTRSRALPRMLATTFQEAATEIAPALAQDPPDQAAVETWLQKWSGSGETTFNSKDSRLTLDRNAMTLIAVGDRQGRVVSTLPANVCAQGALLVDCVPPETTALLLNELEGGKDPDELTVRNDDEIWIAAPILTKAERPVGVLLVAVRVPADLSGPGPFSIVILGSLLPSALIIALFAGGVGSIFGFLTARGLTGRLHTLATAAEAWSQGDFSVSLSDDSRDELGQLARRLNRMAERLKQLLQTRQELAAIEERNRLARELHDAVKQQVFATVMQVAAARNLIDSDPAQAKERLQEAEHLAKQAQQELTALIRELRPAALDGKGLGPALSSYVRDWSRQTGVTVRLQMPGQRALPLPVEQAIFRVIQEALANIARHSQADQVDLMLQWEETSLRLEVKDNGRGFDPTVRRGQGVGLESMVERIQALGGTIRIHSQPGQGATIVAEIPLQAPRTAVRRYG